MSQSDRDLAKASRFRHAGLWRGKEKRYGLDVLGVGRYGNGWFIRKENAQAFEHYREMVDGKGWDMNTDWANKRPDVSCPALQYTDLVLPLEVFLGGVSEPYIRKKPNESS